MAPRGRCLTHATLPPWQPAPVVHTLLIEPDIKAFVRIDGIVTLVDAKHIERRLDERKPDGAVNESMQQVAFADRLLLNKVDLVPSETSLSRIEQRLRSVNRFAPIQRCTMGQVSVDSVLDLNGFDLQRILDRTPTFLQAAASTKHDASVSSHSIDQGAARHVRKVTAVAQCNSQCNSQGDHRHAGRMAVTLTVAWLYCCMAVLLHGGCMSVAWLYCCTAIAWMLRATCNWKDCLDATRGT
jgi:G3E family GTPase